jgi:hypothetical protein
VLMSGGSGGSEQPLPAKGPCRSEAAGAARPTRPRHGGVLGSKSPRAESTIVKADDLFTATRGAGISVLNLPALGVKISERVPHRDGHRNVRVQDECRPLFMADSPEHTPNTVHKRNLACRGSLVRRKCVESLLVMGMLGPGGVSAAVIGSGLILCITVIPMSKALSRPRCGWLKRRYSSLEVRNIGGINTAVSGHDIAVPTGVRHP